MDGRMHLHANVVRFERPPIHSSRPINTTRPAVNGASSFASVLKGNPNNSNHISSSPAMVLDDECVVKRDLDNFVMGEVKDFSSINNLRVLLSNEGFQQVNLAYLGGLWVMIELASVKTKMRFMKHGEVIELEDNNEDCFARKRICIKTKHEDNIFEKFKIIVRGKVFVLRAKELFVWSPTFIVNKDIEYCSEDDSVKGGEENNVDASKQVNMNDDSDVDGVSETYFGDQVDSSGHDQAQNLSPKEKEVSSDPFNLYDLLNKRDKGEAKSGLDSSIPFPPGFTPDNKDAQEAQGMNNSMSQCRSEGLSSRILEDAQPINDHVSSGVDHKYKKGGSILEVLDNMIKVGQTISEAVGNSCGILCAWDPSVFRKEQHVISDNFVALYGSWVSNQVKLLMISIYAPQSITTKHQGGVNDDILLSRLDVLKILHDIKSFDARDYMQKAKVHWAIEGDENSKFFHGIINHKRANLAIKGVMIDVEWVDDPCRVKEEFRLHFANRFRPPADNRFKLNYTFPNRLNSDQVDMLESPITRDEVRTAVWGCGENKYPGPDGYTFEFFCKYWDILGSDFCAAVEWFFDHSAFSRGCNSSFIALILKTHDPKQILDGSFIINELLSWCKHKKQQAMVFKVDFAKAYDSISLQSGMASILLNGSPTSEFQFHCGLKQGDPLAPYLFILIMESLHLSLSRAIEAGIFKGIKIGSTLNISHLFYADDAVFIGEWSIANLSGITHILHCFSLLSGLTINLKKSHLLGVGISIESVNAAALNLGCSTIKTPFKYLGVMVGGNSLTSQAWDDTIGKCKARLSNWKLKTLYVGVRLTLLKSVLGSTPIYNMSIYKVLKSVLHTLESIHRNFFNGVQGDERKIMWIKWTKVLASKKYGGLDLLQKTIETTMLSNMEDRWVWDLNGEGVFRVKDVRTLLDECFLPKAPTATRWVKYVPIKINVFAWKVFLDRLPTRSNLQHRGVQVSDLLCPICSLAQEDSSHLFFSCSLVTDVAGLVCRWWNLSWLPLGSYSDWLNWFNSTRLSSKVKEQPTTRDGAGVSQIDARIVFVVNVDGDVFGIGEVLWWLYMMVAVAVRFRSMVVKWRLIGGQLKVVVVKILLLQGFLGYQKYHILDSVHPELSGPNQNIRNSLIEMDLFDFIYHADPTKVRIDDQAGSVVRVGHGYQNDDIENVGHDDPNKESGDADQEDRSHGNDHVGQDETTTILVDADVQVAAADKPKGKRKKRRATGGASSSNHPLKKLREGYGTSGNVSASTAAIVPFITSPVTPTAKHEGCGDIDSVFGPKLCIHHLSEWSSVPPPPVMTAAVTTTVIAGASSSPILGAGAELANQVYHSLFANSAFIGGPDIAGPFSPADTELFADTFYGSQEIESETIRRIYLAPPRLFSQLRGMDYDKLFVEFNVGASRQTCLGAEVRMRFEHNLRERKRLEGICARQVNLMKEKDAEIANLQAQLSLREAKAVDALLLCNQVSAIEVVEAARVNELNSLKEQNIALEKEKNTLEGQVVALESVAATKDIELASLKAQSAKLTPELSSLQLSSDELSIKAASLESQRDGLIDRLKELSDRVAGLDSKLMALALHLDEEFYPRFLTTIFGRGWIIGHGLRLAVMKCRQSPESATAFGAVIGLAIDKACILKTPTTYSLEEDNVVIGETPLPDSLNVVHDRVQRLKEGALSYCLSISDAMGALVDPLSFENLIGEASTSGVPATVVATTA
nr:RNA-directed DNA polymerase, eukaryota [Tanacetum cinerariifolium]